MTIVLCVIGLVIVQRLSELRLAKRNYEWAMAHDGREYGREHYWLFVALHSSWIAAILLECLLRKPSVPPIWGVFLGLIVFAQVLRYWAIHTLGHCWNTRIIVFKDMQQVTDGPYRYLRHPNYLAVVLEIALIPMLFGAWYTSICFTLLNGALLLFVRIPAENRAIRSLTSTEPLGGHN